MTGLDYVDLLFCNLSQLRKQAVAEVKAKYGLHETQYRNMALVAFTNARIVENKGRWKELIQAEQVPGKAAQGAAMSGRIKDTECIQPEKSEDNCCYTALCSQGWANTTQEDGQILPVDHMQLEGSSSTSSMLHAMN